MKQSPGTKVYQVPGIMSFRFFGLLLLFCSLRIAAQQERTQYPFFLSDHTYFEVDISYIQNHFSNLQVEPGYHAASLNRPPIGVRLILYGYRFNKYLSAQVSYMRPIWWVHYVNVNGDKVRHSLPTNIAGLTVKFQSPLSGKLFAYGEAGLGIVTRTGFSINSIPIVKNANYTSTLLAAGLQYPLNDRLTLQAGGGWSPENKKSKNPATVFFTAGMIYNVHKLSPLKVKENENSGFIFPENLLQIGYTSNVLGYGTNNFFSNTVFPIFWGGDAEVRQGMSIHYQRNVFHGRKLFSLDWGASVSYWQSKIQRQNFYAISLYPLFRFTTFHSRNCDLYFDYSVPGPSFISKVVIDDVKTGKKFTFQDFMGMGAYFGKRRRTNAEIRILHYSNGDLFPDNNGIKVPLSFYAGYTF